MSVEVVRLEVLVDLREVEIDRATPTRSRHSGLGIHDDVVVYDACLNSRRQSQNCGGRVAAGIADEATLRNLITVQFRETVYGSLDVLWTRMG